MSFKFYQSVEGEIRTMKMKDSYKCIVDFVKAYTPIGDAFALLITSISDDCTCFSGYVLSRAPKMETKLYRFSLTPKRIRYAGHVIKVPSE